MNFNATSIEVITFDCYGTLIDRETGIVNALHPLLESKGNSAPPDEILAIFTLLESKAMSGPFIPYPDVLRQVVRGFAFEYQFSMSHEEGEVVMRSMPSWLPFPDTVFALKTLKTKYRIAVISNVDDDLFERTAEQLKVQFDHVITAQSEGAYKPSIRLFRKASNIIGGPNSKILYVSQSLFHDIAPARALGFATAWVDRRGGEETSPIEPEITVPNLTELVKLLQ